MPAALELDDGEHTYESALKKDVNIINEATSLEQGNSSFRSSGISVQRSRALFGITLDCAIKMLVLSKQRTNGSAGTLMRVYL
jgi:hypothetical protein